MVSLAKNRFKYNAKPVITTTEGKLSNILNAQKQENNDLLTREYFKNEGFEPKGSSRFWRDNPMVLLDIQSLNDFIPSGKNGDFESYLNAIVRLAIAVFIILYLGTKNRFTVLIVTLALLLTLHMYINSEKYLNPIPDVKIDDYINSSKNRLMLHSMPSGASMEEQTSDYTAKRDTYMSERQKNTYDTSSMFLYSTSSRDKKPII